MTGLSPKLLSEILKPDDFYLQSHQIIYDGMLKLFPKEPIDLVTIIYLLKKEHMLTEVGGAEYLAGLVDENSNMKYRKDIISIFEYSILRKLIGVTEKIISLHEYQR